MTRQTGDLFQQVPDAPLKIRQGAYLPHWARENAIYAVTFRLDDALPQHVWEGWLLERTSIERRAGEQGRALSESEKDELRHLCSERVERYLDAGHGSCCLADGEAAAVVAGALAHFNGQRYILHAWCVMPNHVHAVVQPLDGWTLEQILHSWKSFTAHAVNKLLNRKGGLWQKESYDHLIRDEADYAHAIEYVLRNPEVARLQGWKWLGRPCQAFES